MLGAFMIRLRRWLHSGVRMHLLHWLGSLHHFAPLLCNVSLYCRVRTERVLLRFCRSFSCSLFRWMGCQPGFLPATTAHRMSQHLWCLGNTNPLKPGHVDLRLNIRHIKHILAPAIWADADICLALVKYARGNWGTVFLILMILFLMIL